MATVLWNCQPLDNMFKYAYKLFLAAHKWFYQKVVEPSMWPTQ